MKIEIFARLIEFCCLFACIIFFYDERTVAWILLCILVELWNK